MFDKSENKLVDFIGRLENFQNDFDKVCDYLKIPRKNYHDNLLQKKENTTPNTTMTKPVQLLRKNTQKTLSISITNSENEKMIISHKYKFIYFANGKCATSTIENALAKYNDDDRIKTVDLSIGKKGVWIKKKLDNGVHIKNLWGCNTDTLPRHL